MFSRGKKPSLFFLSPPLSLWNQRARVKWDGMKFVPGEGTHNTNVSAITMHKRTSPVWSFLGENIFFHVKANRLRVSRKLKQRNVVQKFMSQEKAQRWWQLVLVLWYPWEINGAWRMLPRMHQSSLWKRGWSTNLFINATYIRFWRTKELAQSDQNRWKSTDSVSSLWCMAKTKFFFSSWRSVVRILTNVRVKINVWFST